MGEIKKNYVVEKVFDHSGLKCVVVMQSMGHRCGYVGVDEKHPLYGKSCHDYLDIKKDDIKDKVISGVFPLLSAVFDDDERVKIEAFFNVHGGITYANEGKNSKYPIESDLWWFGFDCGHYGDRNDIDTAKKLFAENEEIISQLDFLERIEKLYPTNEAAICTLDYVENECRNLAD